MAPRRGSSQLLSCAALSVFAWDDPVSSVCPCASDHVDSDLSASTGAVEHVAVAAPRPDRGLCPPLRRPSRDLPLHLQAPRRAARLHPGDVRTHVVLCPGHRRAEGPVRRGRHHFPDGRLLQTRGPAASQLPETRSERLHAQAQPR